MKLHVRRLFHPDRGAYWVMASTVEGGVEIALGFGPTRAEALSDAMKDLSDAATQLAVLFQDATLDVVGTKGSVDK